VNLAAEQIDEAGSVASRSRQPWTGRDVRCGFAGRMGSGSERTRSLPSARRRPREPTDGSVTTVRQGLGSSDRTLSPDPSLRHVRAWATGRAEPSGLTRTLADTRTVSLGTCSKPAAADETDRHASRHQQRDPTRLLLRCGRGDPAECSRPGATAGRSSTGNRSLGRVVSHTGFGLSDDHVDVPTPSRLRCRASWSWAGTAFRLGPLSFEATGRTGCCASVEDALGGDTSSFETL